MAVNTNHLAVNPATVVGSQEANNTGNVDGETDTVERRPGSGVLCAELVNSSRGRQNSIVVLTYLVDALVVEVGTAGDVLAADGVVHVRLDTTGGNAVDSDLLVTEVW